MRIAIFDTEENIVEKGENAGYQHFLLFPTMFSKASSCRLADIVGCMERVNKFEKERAYICIMGKSENNGEIFSPMPQCVLLNEREM